MYSEVLKAAGVIRETCYFLLSKGEANTVFKSGRRKGLRIPVKGFIVMLEVCRSNKRSFF